MSGRMENRSFRRLVRQLFSSWIKRQNCHCRRELTKFAEQLQEVEELIEVMAREMARQGKRMKSIGEAVGCDNQPVSESEPPVS